MGRLNRDAGRMERIEFLGCPVDSLDIPKIFEWMEMRIKTRNPAMIAQINAHSLWMMSKNSRLDRIVKESDLIVPEWAIVWGAKKLGLQLDSWIIGCQLVRESLHWAQTKGFRLFFLGARPEVVEQLAIILKRDYPKLQIAGINHGYLDQAETDKVIERIKATKPDVLWVAMGMPKQEYWINEHFTEIQVPISMGVGGSFDVLAGLKKDTPSWARGHGWEWLYRLSQDPKAYWKRYLITNSWIIWNVYKIIIRNKFTRK